MPDRDAVAAALARLAAGESQSPGHEAVIDDAEAALDSIERAATFVQAGREAALRDAVEASQERGDRGTAARGREVLATLARYRQAATPEDGSAGDGDHDDHSDADRRTDGDGHSDSDDDHFHRARTTLLGGGGLPRDR